MTWLNSYLDNREIAIFFWIGILFLWAIFNRNVRKSLIGVFQAFAQRAVAIASLLMILYIGLIIYISHQLNLWGTSNFGTIILWVFGVAFVMFINISHVSKDNFFRDIILDNIKFVVILEFVTNIYVFDLWIELLLVPILAFTGAIWGYSSTDPKYKKVNSCLTTVVSLIGLLFIIYALYNILVDFQGFASINNLREFIIPVIFTVAFLPFIYVLALYLSYDLIYMRIRHMIKDKKLARYARIKTVFAFHINLKQLRIWLRKIVLQKFINKEDINRAIKDSKASSS